MLRATTVLLLMLSFNANAQGRGYCREGVEKSWNFPAGSSVNHKTIFREYFEISLLDQYEIPKSLTDQLCTYMNNDDCQNLSLEDSQKCRIKGIVRIFKDKEAEIKQGLLENHKIKPTPVQKGSAWQELMDGYLNDGVRLKYTMPHWCESALKTKTGPFIHNAAQFAKLDPLLLLVGMSSEGFSVKKENQAPWKLDDNQAYAKLEFHSEGQKEAGIEQKQYEAFVRGSLTMDQAKISEIKRKKSELDTFGMSQEEIASHHKSIEEYYSTGPGHSMLKKRFERFTESRNSFTGTPDKEEMNSSGGKHIQESFYGFSWKDDGTDTFGLEYEKLVANDLFPVDFKLMKMSDIQKRIDDVKRAEEQLARLQKKGNASESELQEMKAAVTKAREKQFAAKMSFEEAPDLLIEPEEVVNESINGRFHKNPFQEVKQSYKDGPSLQLAGSTSQKAAKGDPGATYYKTPEVQSYANAALWKASQQKFEKAVKDLAITHEFSDEEKIFWSKAFFNGAQGTQSGAYAMLRTYANKNILGTSYLKQQPMDATGKPIGSSVIYENSRYVLDSYKYAKATGCPARWPESSGVVRKKRSEFIAEIRDQKNSVRSQDRTKTTDQ